jgi:hypothetical protein
LGWEQTQKTDNAAQAWREGSGERIIAGFPVSVWVELTEESYDIGMMGIRFNGFPDGKSLMQQEQCVVDILKVVLIELAKEFSSGAKKHN